MQKILVSLGLACTMTVASSAAFAQSKQDFTLINETGWVVYRLFVSESANTKWEEDVLGKGVLGSGKDRKITFSGYGKNVCLFDMKVEDQAKKGWVINNVNLCKVRDVTIRMRDGRMVYTAK